MARVTVSVSPVTVYHGAPVRFTAEATGFDKGSETYCWFLSSIGATWKKLPGTGPEISYPTNELPPGEYSVQATTTGTVGGKERETTGEASFTVEPNVEIFRDEPLRVELQRFQRRSAPSLWIGIRNRTKAISFPIYHKYMTSVMCEGGSSSDSYDCLREATEAFLMQECGVVSEEMIKDKVVRPKTILDPITGKETRIEETIEEKLINEDDESNRLPKEFNFERAVEYLRNNYLVEIDSGKRVLPYMRRIRNALSELPLKDGPALPNCYGILPSMLDPCMIELIWSYWMEEGLLVQSMNAIMLRFQNRRTHANKDPLAHLNIDFLRPLSSLLWGYISDEQHRLSVVRRNYEYDHHYGINLVGKAVPQLRSVDSRSRFLEAFHKLLNLCSKFYKEADDTTRISDGFPVLNALKEVHLLLAEGMGNQYRSLPWNARVEMLMQQWILARPELRDFLGHLITIPYAQPWMGRVDTMKKLQGWNDTSVMHFHILAEMGEQILLSIRYDDWNNMHEAASAVNWALYFRNEIQAYIHAYRTVTGVDLTRDPVNYTRPSVLLLQRAKEQSAALARS